MNEAVKREVVYRKGGSINQFVYWVVSGPWVDIGTCLSGVAISKKAAKRAGQHALRLAEAQDKRKAISGT